MNSTTFPKPDLNCLEVRVVDRAGAICHPCNSGYPERCRYLRRPFSAKAAPTPEERQVMEQVMESLKHAALAMWALGGSYETTEAIAEAIVTLRNRLGPPPPTPPYSDAGA